MVGRPGRTLYAVLEHLEGGNEPPLKYPTPSFSRRSESWLPRRMASASLASFGSRSSGMATLPFAVKPEPQEIPLRRHSRGSNLVINEGCCQPSPSRGHLRLVKPKKEPAATIMVKKEHEAMAANLDDYVREEMEG
ncbi:hypothetical protein D1007_58402 [Hordeum vulgare]|nr:hypothetical protein D1007_58402 [Hordeum vulgare]